MDERGTLTMRSTTGPSGRFEPRLRLVWTAASSPVAGATFPLPLGDHVIGRDAGAGRIALTEDARASREHAALRVTAREVSAEDRGSRNGTFVNGQRLALGERRVLDEGAVLRVGETLFVLRTEPEEEDAEIDEILGDAPAARRLRRQIARVAADTSTVLLIGETGTGKELATGALHRLSGRPGPRIDVNMGAIPAELAESQLFGHLAGAFTGAKAQLGYFRAAHRGTLFLDEIGELSLTLQPKLLRALEERAVLPVGSTTPVPVDARLIAATNRDLDEAVAEGEFREDLYARLGDIIIRPPPLRERREDIMPLFAHANGGVLPELATELAEELICHPWPRNVRELLKVANHLRLFGADAALRDRLRGAGRRGPAAAPADVEAQEPASGDRERERVAAVAASCKGNVTAMAAQLGTSRSQVRRLVERHAIDLDRYRR